MSDAPSCWAVLPAAGSGRRMAAAIPKQYLPLAGATVMEHSLNALLACPDIRAVAVVLDPADRRNDDIVGLRDARVRIAPGGRERADSVLAGLDLLAEQAGGDDWVLVHDAARPCVAVTSINRLITEVQQSGVGGLLAEPVVDTVKRATAEGKVESTPDRANLWRAQTPQMFRLRELRDALRDARREGKVVTDEASAMEMAGHEVQLVAGSPRNLKVTVQADLALAEYYLSHPAEDE
ncbi:MAG: 2-C-methyl-D-erythritol 4-phosphate cytidylyltransferase [Halieaceae bacterium]|nr:2-C-methyl-D-erythritol 4-phosphate cytidylyltransferase [Halieaceae bacterium]